MGALFRGRAAVLSRIHDAMRRGGRYGATLTAQVIEGMGGIGKTRAAVEYAWAHRDDYTALLFVNAETPDGLAHDLAALTEVLGLDHLNDQPEDLRRSAVLNWLNSNPGWLLILDNIDTDAAAKAVGDLLGKLSGGHVLLTSRRQGFAPGVEAIALAGLDRADAAALLLERTEGGRLVTQTDPLDATSLAEELEGLPLALEMAAATIRERHCSLADYRRLWRESRDTLIGPNEPVISTYPRNIDVALLGAVGQLAAEAHTLLERLAFFAPDPVPAFLLDVPVPNGGTAPEAAWQALDDLAAHSLASRDPDGAGFTVHRLVQDATRRRLDAATASRRLAEALDWVDTAFAGDPEDVHNWPKLDPLAPHAWALLWAADRAGITEPTTRLMRALGRLFQGKGEFARAEPLMRRALAINEASFGADHPNVARDLNNLAVLLQATNRLGEAEPLMRRALGIEEASVGNDHPDVATALNNLAQLLRATNRLAEAEPMMRRALAIDEASVGGDHPEVAIRLNNLAQLLQETNRLAEAEPLMRRAIAIDEADLGADHPNVAIRLNNLAQLLQDTNRLAEAESLMRRALAIDEASLGADHPEVAIHLNNLATLLQDTNRLAEAEPLMRRALAIDEASLGNDHPNVAVRLNNLASLLRATNRLGEAEPLMRRALGIDEASYGKDHPNVAIRLNNLAGLLRATNRLGEAEPLYRRALAIFCALEAAIGRSHPSRETVQGNYAGLLTDMGKSETEIAATIAAVRREAGLDRS